MFIPYQNFSIPDPNFFHSGSASKHLSILTKKIVSQLSEILSRLFIPDPDPDFVTHPGSRCQKGTGSRIRIRNTGIDRGVYPHGLTWCPGRCSRRCEADVPLWAGRAHQAGQIHQAAGPAP
jgi:hypothetical protein